jgi:hypothetical protein
MATKTIQFEYTPLPAVAAANKRLHELRDQIGFNSQSYQDLVDAERKAYDELIKRETDAALGDASSKEVAAARSAWEAAQAARAAAGQNHGADAVRKGIEDVFGKLERLKQQEQEANLKTFKPLYKAAIEEFDQTLAAAQAAGERLDALRRAGGQLSNGWPAGWKELADNMNSRLYWWREACKQHELL